MAKNEGMPTVTAGIVSREREGEGGVNQGEHTFLRKDTQFFVRGNWYVTITCPVCGVVDEEIAWADAKTPHHAGLNADQRHAKCNVEMDVETRRATALQEIEAARHEVARVDALYNTAAERLKAAEQSGEKARIKDAQRGVEYYLRSPLEARKRLADIEAANAVV